MTTSDGQATRRLVREIRPTGVLNFPLALTYVNSWTASTLERIDLVAGTWQRALMLDGHDLLITVGSSATPGALMLEIAGLHVSPELLDRAEREVRRIFALNTDPAAFTTLAYADDILRPIVTPYEGMRPIVVADLYESLVWAILGQQINVSFARRLKDRLVETCGHELVIGDTRYPVLPRPEVVAALDPAVLLAQQFSRQKTAYVIGVSEEIASGRLDLHELATLPDDEAIDELVGLRGVGRWTAEYVLMRGMGREDVIPAGDVSLQLLIGTAATGARVREPELRAIAERWRPWRSWATFFVWMSRQFGA